MKMFGLGGLEFAVVGFFAFAVRIGLSIAAGFIARGKGQSFALFLIVGLFLGSLPALIIAAAVKPAQTQIPCQPSGFNGSAPVPPAPANQL